MLTQEEYSKLLRFFGYGNFQHAEIVFWGNEEGCGGDTVQNNVNWRCNHYGRRNGEYVYCINGNNWRSGFYEPNAGTILNGLIQNENKPKGDFLRMAARIMSALDNPVNIPTWFETFGENPINAKTIRAYMRNELFVPRDTGIQTALVDWKPLPRRNENEWDDYYGLINSNWYLSAFNLNFQAKDPPVLQDEFTNYIDDVYNRMDLLKAIFESYPFSVLIGLGDTRLKRQILEQTFNIEFEDLLLGDENIGYSGQIEINNQEKNIFLMPFPSAHVFHHFEQSALQAFSELTANYLCPIFNNNL